MKQRDIYWANLNPSQGREQRGIRPVVILSGNAMNDHFGLSIVCPLSTKIKNYAGCVVLRRDGINKLPQDSEVLTFHIRTVSQAKFTQKIGEVTKEQFEEIRKGLDEILTY